jgi:hypothetical protein
LQFLDIQQISFLGLLRQSLTISLLTTLLKLSEIFVSVAEYYTVTRGEKTELSLYLEIDEWLVGMNFTYRNTLVKNISGPTECERVYECLLSVLQIDHLLVLLFVKLACF